MNDNGLIGKTRIQQIVSLIDLTNLNDDCDGTAVEQLCAQATMPTGFVAAICIWPNYISAAKQYLDKRAQVQIATVVNFPSGDEILLDTCDMIEKALNDGATEIDYVLPYKALIKGNTNQVSKAIKTVRQAIPSHYKLKVILETGELKTDELIRTAANIAIDEGADFIKTSTGKVSVNATPNAAMIMLNAIAELTSTAQSERIVGFKAAGGIGTVEQANAYLKIAENRLGKSWVNSTHFRFGASSLLQDALAKLGERQALSSEDKGSY